MDGTVYLTAQQLLAADPKALKSQLQAVAVGQGLVVTKAPTLYVKELERRE